MYSAQQPLLKIAGLCKTYVQGRWWQSRFQVCALDHVDLTMNAGETFALVGESGSGKTTLAMCLMGLEQPDAGDIWFEGKRLAGLRSRTQAGVTGEIQMIFQDSAGALNPGMSMLELIEEPLLIRGKEKRGERQARVLKAMEQVGLPASWKNRRQHELSGGQRQRLAIARALVLEPKLLILDEALAGLDLSMQGQISNLLLDLQASHGISYLYISHNFKLVTQFADDVVVLDRGQVIKTGKAVQLLGEDAIANAFSEISGKEKAMAMYAGK